MPYKQAAKLAWMLAAVLLLLVWAAVAPAEQTSAAESTPDAGAAQPVIPREDIDRSPFYFSIPKRYGNPRAISFTDIVYEQNAVILLWVTDCPLCKLQLRHLNQVADWAAEHPEANLRVISFNLDLQGSRRLEAEEWEEGMEPRFEVFFDPGARHFDQGLWQLEQSGVPVVFFFAQGGFPRQTLTGFNSNLLTLVEREFGRQRSAR